MKSSNRAWLLLGAAALAAAIPALAQNRDAPESLLPEGFGDPGNLPPPETKQTPQQGNAQRPAAGQPAGRADELVNELTGPTEEEVDPLGGPRPTNYFSIPVGTSRPTDMVGLIEPGNFGMAPNAFGNDGGAFRAGLMRGLDAPLPSRWASILLRRALMSRLAAPAGINPVDWVAERADLLLRMGEADAARMLVQSVDDDEYTSRMIEVAAQAALATADPSGLCPVAGPARARSGNASWLLAEAMCAGLESEAARAGALIDQARNQGATGIDLALAEKVIGASGETRRSTTVEWEQVPNLDAWRFGLASATGTEIPAPLMARAGPAIRAWFARAPMMPPEARADAAETAAALGVFSSRALVELHSLIFDRTDVAERGDTVGARLREAWIAELPGDRVAAMRRLWEETPVAPARYGRLVLTAGAAAEIDPAPDYTAELPNLIASMLSAGLDQRAALWADTVEQAGDQRAWAMLAAGTPRPAAIDSDRVQDYVSTEGGRRGELLVAALGGLGRIAEADATSLARDAGIDLAARDAWSQALDAAAAARQPGMVALLVAVGMQTSHWGGVPPRNLYRSLRALRAVGLEYEARMIAAEAIART
ncbi:hypothetical protein [Sphingosinicella sp.]|uniref:hypothetical protein n=1 Tax=Sphingosinicella sp. TaxID=1917971 RepID=UPI0040384353